MKTWLTLILDGKFEWLHNSEARLDDRILAQCSSITMCNPIPNPSNIIGISVLLGALGQSDQLQYSFMYEFGHWMWKLQEAILKSATD